MTLFEAPLHYWQFNCQKDKIVACGLTHPRNYPLAAIGQTVTKEMIDEKHEEYYADPRLQHRPILQEPRSQSDKEYLKSYHHHITDYDVFRSFCKYRYSNILVLGRNHESMNSFDTNIGNVPVNQRTVSPGEAKEFADLCEDKIRQQTRQQAIKEVETTLHHMMETIYNSLEFVQTVTRQLNTGNL